MSGFNLNRDRQIADEYLASHGKCMFCGCATERQTLSDYGARCGPCFNAYVTQGRRAPPMPTLEERKAILKRFRGLADVQKHPHAWAHRLQSRRADGEVLSKAQKDCLRLFELRHGCMESV